MIRCATITPSPDESPAGSLRPSSNDALSPPPVDLLKRAPSEAGFTSDASGAGIGPMTRAVGIDLGTTNTVVAVVEGGEPTIVANAEGSRTTPSVVCFAQDGTVFVGQSAKNQVITNAERTVSSVKRHMGTDWMTDDIDGKRYLAHEISAIVLQKLKRDVDAYMGEEIADAVITVPAYFDDTQRQATKEAGQMAGFNVVRIINEPGAAALAYGLESSDKDQNVLIFALGGGTFDVSVLEIGEGVIEVKAASGDNRLGGDDWDARISAWLVDKCKSFHGIDLARDRMAMQRVHEASERAKIELSSQNTTTINLPYITVDADRNPLFLDESLSRRELQRITSDLLDRTRNPLERAISDAGLHVGDIDQIIMVGGATYMPAVTDLVTEVLGKEPIRTINPDLVVAAGAALAAGAMGGEPARSAVSPDAVPTTRSHSNGDSGIFISYRRSDDPSFAGRLHDRLAAKFGEAQIFMDVDRIELGLDFGEELERSLNSCSLMIAIIGRGWLDARAEDGSRRLDNPDDWVRLEIASALRRGIRVIPVLANGARMPRHGELPADLASLARRNAHSMSHARFGSDILKLISTIEQVLSS
jgi:actin-like ATPase involved in cell morphogenesis